MKKVYTSKVIAEEELVDTKLDDIQDVEEEMEAQVREPVFDVHNNIENHYIAECQSCKEFFVSAVTESDTPVENITGECPCCHDKTTQVLRWIIRSVEETDE